MENQDMEKDLNQVEEPVVTPEPTVDPAPAQPQQSSSNSYYVPPSAPNSQSPLRGRAIAALVLGIISVALFWAGYFSIATLACGIVGTIIAIGVRKAMATDDPSRGLATAGLVLSVIGLVLSAISFIGCVVLACVGFNILSYY